MDMNAKVLAIADVGADSRGEFMVLCLMRPSAPMIEA